MAKVIEVSRKIRNDVLNRKYSKRIPPVRQLADTYNINLKTANKAIRMLVDEGLLISEVGRGTFVRDGVQEGQPSDQGTIENVAALCVKSEGDMVEDLYGGLVSGLHAKGWYPLLLPHGESGGSRQRIDDLLKLSPSALIIDSAIYHIDYDYLKQVAHRLRKIVFLTHRQDDHEFNNGVYVESDYFHGTYHAVRHLQELGHRNILLLHEGQSGHSLSYRYTREFDFENGYRYAMQDAGHGDQIRFFTHLPGSRWFDESSGRRIKELFSSPDRPTAVVSFLDSWLVELMTILGTMGLAVPQDVSMIGFHDTQWATNAKPALSSVSLRVDEIAKLAVEKATDPGNNFGIISIKPELITRDSCARRDGL